MAILLQQCSMSSLLYCTPFMDYNYQISVTNCGQSMGDDDGRAPLSQPGKSGLNGSLFNMFGNSAAITTPIVIGYILQGTGSFDGALIFIGANALVAVFCYLVIVGEIKRAEIVRR